TPLWGVEGGTGHPPSPGYGEASRPVATTLRLTEPAEINLAKRLCQFAEIVPQVLNDFRPNILANYLFELANSFHTFYEACPVLKSEEPARSSRPDLCDLTARVLKHGLDLLGIKVPEKMYDKAEGSANPQSQNQTLNFGVGRWTVGVGRLLPAVKKEHPRIPTCTYRLQFNRWFTFSDARAIVPYLHALGVSDVYASPYFQASPDSLHGYDITDHNKLNAAIGSRADYDAWIGRLHEHSMGQVLDFVPNHVGVADSRNQWWMDVLENGRSSRYAPYFDMDWEPRKLDLRDKVLLPILSNQYGRVLERGEFQVRFEEGKFFLLFGERKLTIAHVTCRYVLEIALKHLAGHKDEGLYPELQSILTALEYLPKRTETDPKRIAERIREKEIIKRRLERRCAEA